MISCLTISIYFFRTLWGETRNGLVEICPQKLRGGKIYPCGEAWRVCRCVCESAYEAVDLKIAVSATLEQSGAFSHLMCAALTPHELDLTARSID